MGLLTFSEMQEQVRSMLGARSDKDATIMRGLQFAQWKISRIFHFDELYTQDEVSLSNTGSGNELTDATITLPSTTRKLHALVLVKDTQNIPLKGLPSERWEKIISDPSTYDRGEPYAYVVRFRTCYVFQVPDTDYTLKRLASYWPTEITLNDDKDAPSSTTATSDLDHKDDLIVLAATVWTALNLGKDYRDQANFFFTVFKNTLQEAGAFEESKPGIVNSASPDVILAPDYLIPTFGAK